MKRAAAIVAIVLLAGVAGAAQVDLGSEQQRERGRELYDKYCSQCHGETGDGNGYATHRVWPKPRDFTSGKYKFRATPNGMLPTDDDIKKVIRDGLPYTSMPGWPMFNEQDLQNITYYLKTFSEDFSDPEKLGDPIDIPEPPAITAESVERGRTVFESQGCAACHGKLGRSDGLSAPTLTDDAGDTIRAVDMTKRWTFRGGPTRKDIFRTFSTGVNGTPMPSYAESLAVEDRWDLVNYIYSLGDGDDPGYSNLLLVQFVEDELVIDDPDTLFADAPLSRFPLVGQIVEPGRNFYPTANGIEVQAVYNRQEIAFLLRWNDMRAETAGTNSPAMEVPPWDEDNPRAAADDTGGEGDDFWGEEIAEGEGDEDFWGEEIAEGEGDEDFWGEEEEDTAVGGEFSDAVALQFPSTLPTGIRKPYFILGDAQSPVDLWFIDLARPTMVEQYVARGSQAVEFSQSDDFEVHTSYDQGRWSVVLKRAMRGDGGISFTEDGFAPLAFSVWDGFNRERGNKRALSAWFYLYVEPSERISPVGPMIKAAAITLVVQLLFIFFVRRIRARRSDAEAGAVALPEGGAAG